jgi:hypothetical protein
VPPVATKAFALGARVTLGPSPSEVAAVRQDIQRTLLPLDDADTAAVYVVFNGEMLGLTRDPEGLVYDLRRRIRSRGSVHPYDVPTAYVSPCGGHVYVYHDEGRIMRPLLVVRDGHLPDPARSLDALLSDGLIRYVDAAEIGTSDVALLRRTTEGGVPPVVRRAPDVSHLRAKQSRGVAVDLMEVHAHLILGVTAALIPFLQAVRVVPSRTGRGGAPITRRQPEPAERVSDEHGAAGRRGSAAARPVRTVPRVVLRAAAAVSGHGAQDCGGGHGVRAPARPEPRRCRLLVRRM